MKKVLFFLCSVSLSAMVLAAPVDKGTARRLAAQFLQEQRSEGGQATSRMAQKPVLESQQSDGAGYYVFNNKSGGGFVIVSGDDTVDNAILGYNTEGSLTEDNMPEALRFSLQEYAEAVKFAQANGLSMKRGPRKANRADVSPFINFRWNQGTPYCNLTPEANNSYGHCSLGCMAVSVAMIVAYYQYPETLPAHINSSSGSSSEAHAYDYATFKSKYSNNDNLGEMPLFTLHVANLLDTKFSADGSGAIASRFIPTMTDYLGYNKNMKSITRYSYSAEDWDEIIYNELEAKRPVNFLGEHPDLGGHSYIADGYRASDGFFHIIWGWGDNCVGYFDMNVLNPFVAYFSQWGQMGYSVPPGGFTSGLTAIIGIQKEDAGEAFPQLMTTDDIIKEMVMGVDGVRATFFNYDDRVFRGQISWALLGDNDTFTQIDNAPIKDINVSYKGYTTQNLAIGSNLGLADGSYKIVPICKTNEEGAKWNLCEGYLQRYVEVEIVNGNITIVPHPVKNVAAEVLVYKGGTGTQYMELLLKLHNLGDDVYGYLTVNGMRDDNVKVYGSKIDVAVKAGQSQLLSVFLENGGTNSYGYSGHTYTVNVEYMHNNIGTFELDPSKYSPSSSYFSYKGVEFEDYGYDDNSNAYLYNTTLKGNVLINCSSSYYYGPVKLTLKDEGKNVIYEKSEVYNFTKNNEVHPYYMEANGLQAGKKYYLTAQLIKPERSGEKYSETLVKSFFTDFEINVTAAIPYYKEDGTTDRKLITGDEKIDLPANSTAVDFRSFGSEWVNLASITNPNCLYVFPANATVPAELDGRNVIVGGVAQQVTLIDGEPVAFPANFMSNSIEYKRTFTTGYSNGGGWTTVIVPFDAKVKVNGENVEWFKGAKDSGRKFWLFKYKGSVEGTVYFDYETNDVLSANTPYLMAVPGNQFGSTYDLTNKEFTFYATQAAITGQALTEVDEGPYTFRGTYVKDDALNGYMLNNAGDFFELQNTNVEVSPFRAFFSTEETATSRFLRVSMFNGATAVSMPVVSNVPADAVYDLQGRRADSRQLKKGIYIVGGKKVVR